MFLCEKCGKKFKLKEDWEKHAAKHSGAPEKKKYKVRSKHILVFAALFIAGFAIATLMKPSAQTFKSAEDTYLDEPFPFGREFIHWHATPSIYICGEKREIPSPQGDTHLGFPDMHTHSDKLIHIESTVSSRRQIILKRFFEGIGITFSASEILGKKNGDLCGNKTGNVKMTVNGADNKELENYVPRDGDKIDIRFE